MALAAEMRDDPSGKHCYRVGRMASFLASACGQSSDTCASMEFAARLHDIGKLAIPDTLLRKRQLLTDGEYRIIQTHTSVGADLLARAPLSYSQLAEEIARGHHERYDGRGYPSGICGTSIPVAARIVAVCDVYDSLTHKKPYRRALTSDEAIAEMRRGRDLQFDPVLFDLFVPLVAKLRVEHGDVDAFLSEAAHSASLTVARQKISEFLARSLAMSSDA